MFKALLRAGLLAAASPALAFASGGNNLPQPFYSNGFDTSTFTVVDGQKITLHSITEHYAGAITASDPFFALAVGATPTPFVDAKAQGGNGVDATGGGTIIYYFAVSGPNALVVPLTAHIVIHAVVGGSAGSVESDGGNVNVFTDLTSVSRTVTASFGGVGPAVTHASIDDLVGFTATANSNQFNQIEVIGEAAISETLLQHGYAHLFADPVIAIDPAWAAIHPGYSLKFSATIGNLAGPDTVPEPAMWGLMTLGFGAVGTVVRRRRPGLAA